MMTFTVPADKSVSHRAVLLGAIAQGKTVIHNILLGQDCMSTIGCAIALGADVEIAGTTCIVHGNGISGLKEPADFLNAGNSGTTARLLSGILAGLPFTSFISGDESLNKRPMGRIIDPLSKMGAKITAAGQNSRLPMCIQGGRLQGINYTLPVASAQVKSCILLAGLFAEGVTTVTEPAASRDHTERMLPAFGVQIEKKDLSVSVQGGQTLQGAEITVPGDISSAAFLIGAALITRSSIKIVDVGLNPLRAGCIDIFRRMGADIRILNIHEQCGEPVGDIEIHPAALHGIHIKGDIIPVIIDEIPVISAVAACADGETEIHDAEELRKKESDRIEAVCSEFSKMGIITEEYDDGLKIIGRTMNGSKDVTVFTRGDHRIAMAMHVLSLAYGGKVEIDYPSCVTVSFPGFFEIFENGWKREGI